MSTFDFTVQTKDPPWIVWFGGECPVPKGTLVDVIYRDGDIANSVPAGVALYEGFYAEVWTHEGITADIIAYRVSPEAGL
jgi:hypothetical protein